MHMPPKVKKIKAIKLDPNELAVPTVTGFIYSSNMGDIGFEPITAWFLMIIIYHYEPCAPPIVLTAR